MRQKPSSQLVAHEVLSGNSGPWATLIHTNA